MKALVTGASGGIGSAVAAAFENGGHGVLRQDLRAPADSSDGFVVGNLTDEGVLAESRRSRSTAWSLPTVSPAQSTSAASRKSRRVS
jgi:nucleoside-diphosphate-sugar epimerase